MSAMSAGFSPGQQAKRVEAAVDWIMGGWALFRDPHAVSAKAPMRSELRRDEIREIVEGSFAAADEAVPAGNHAPWCRWAHVGPCPAENEPAPDHPVWARLERAEAAARDFARVLRGIQRHATVRGRVAMQMDCQQALARHPGYGSEESTVGEQAGATVRVRLDMTLDEADDLWAILGERPHLEDWSRELFYRLGSAIDQARVVAEQRSGQADDDDGGPRDPVSAEWEEGTDG